MHSSEPETIQSTGSVNVPDRTSSQVESRDSSATQDHQPERQNGLEQTKYNVETIIKQVVRLTGSVHKSGTYSALEQADEHFNPRDHQDLEKRLWMILTVNPSQYLHRQPQLKALPRFTVVQRRLVEANLRRRNRFLYAQKNIQNLVQTRPVKGELEPSSCLVQLLPLGCISNVLKVLARWKTPEQLPISFDQYHNQSTDASERIETVLTASPTNLQRTIGSPGLRSSQSATNPVSASTHRRISYPRAPFLEIGQDKFRCPYCCQVRSRKCAAGEKWRKHLEQDILPYTCILDDCPTPWNMYSNKDAWVEHMRSSHEGFGCWICPICPEQRKFLLQSEFTLHLQEMHIDSDGRDSVLAPMLSGHHSVPIELARCPLCPQAGSNEGLESTVSFDHVADHVHEFSLHSLPWVPRENIDSRGSRADPSFWELDYPTLDDPELREARENTSSQENDYAAIEDSDSNEATECTGFRENDSAAVDDSEIESNQAQYSIEHADLLLAREALPLVGEIATELAAETGSCLLGSFGARLACLVTELHSSKHDFKDRQDLDEISYKVLEEVEKACIWPETKETPKLSTLKSLARSRRANRTIFSWTTWHPAGTLQNHVRECLGVYSSSTAEFAKVLNVIKETTMTRIEGSPSEISKHSLAFAEQKEKLSRSNKKEALERMVRGTKSIALSQAFKTYTMSRKTRCILAYILTKSFWKYYGSQWMKYPWTREDVHLLDNEPMGSDFSSHSHFFKPFITTGLQKNQESIPEYIEGGMFWHRYPQILALGILLIEIAQGEPFEVPNIPLDFSRDSINHYVKSARMMVEHESLFDKKGVNFDLYREAVEGCLKFDQLFDLPSNAGQKRARERVEDLEERRAGIYLKILLPLKELLRGTRWLTEIEEMRHDLVHGAPIPLADTPAIPETRLNQSIQTLRSKAGPETLVRRPHLSHGKARLTPASWIAELVSISEILAPSDQSRYVRIAVIDTGCNLAGPIFDTPGQRARLQGHWRDWLDESRQPLDEHGRGTEIVSLLLRILPRAEIFVARVARGQQDLNAAGGLIAKAIDHAATDWMADIITMSFGFPHEDIRIKKAIRKAEEERNGSILFFAAATIEKLNVEELFPANFDPVIPIRGTDCTGTFVPSYDPDVSRLKHGIVLYGTLGEDVPWSWPDEDKLSSGCSIATPIAAGIAAFIVQCVESKPGFFNKEDQRRIRTRSAILEIFYEISVEKAMNRRYIHPRNLLDKADQPNLALIRHVLSRLP